MQAVYKLEAASRVPSPSLGPVCPSMKVTPCVALQFVTNLSLLKQSD